ncbi:MAG: hypothetical protein OXC28_21810, partial [Defluviicoccus sp.]|nr:hypothetical protein [Defluviicoccus sp.]
MPYERSVWTDDFEKYRDADRVPAGGVRAWRPLRYPAGRAGAAQAATAGSLTARLSLTGAMDSSV